jgi:azurin
MKNNWIVYGSLGILMACNNSSEKNMEGSSSALSINQQIAVNPDEDATVDAGKSGETLEKLSELEKEEDFDRVGKSKTEKLADTGMEQPEEDLEVVASDPSTAVEEPTAVAKKSSQLEPEPVVREKKELAKPQAPKDTLIIMEIEPDMMKFNTDLIEVKAGQKVIVELENLDGMQHNMLIIMPGTLEKVGVEADALARDPKGAQQHYVPDMPEVLHATKLLNPDDIATLTFTAPKEPGDYPFVCTFPGHWRMMNGIMKVTK